MLDDTLELAERLSNCGRCITLNLVEGESHGFLHKGNGHQIVAIAIEQASAWINQVASTAGPIAKLGKFPQSHT